MTCAHDHTASQTINILTLHASLLPRARAHSTSIHKDHTRYATWRHPDRTIKSASASVLKTALGTRRSFPSR
eukprot:scaffold119678_cov33-Tisochrysis_lutea.AAC.4